MRASLRLSVACGLVTAMTFMTGRSDASSWAITRYSSTGVAEPSVISGTTNLAGVTSVFTTSAGEVFVGGFAIPSTSGGVRFAFVSKYTSALVPAPNFQTSGWGVGTVAWQYPAPPTVGEGTTVKDMALTTGNKILVLFSVGGTAVLTRLLATVANLPSPIDTSFGNAGFVFPFGTRQIAAGSLKADAAHIVVTGNVEVPTAFQVARLTLTGAFDTTFGVGGVANPAFTTSAQARDIARGVAIDPSGRVVVVGRSESATGNITLNIVRLTTAGALDTTYDADGMKTVDIPGITNEEATAVAVDASSNVYIAARRNLSVIAVPQVYVAKTNSAGVTDTTFGSSGIANTTFPGGTADNPYEWSIALTNDTLPKVVVAGTVSTSSGLSFGVARFASTGVLDPSFGGGTVVTSFTGNKARAFGVSFDTSSSKVVVAGSLTN